MSLLGRQSTVSSLRRMQARTRTDQCDLYEEGGDDGRGGFTDPVEHEANVEVAARPLSSEDTIAFIGQRLTDQDPHAFFFAHDQSLPDDCYILYDGTLYREEDRLSREVSTQVVAVRCDDQSTA